MIDIRISNQPLNVAESTNWVMTPESGGINIFVGTVRGITMNKKVVRLEFETYANMASVQMEKIAEEVLKKWPVHRILIHHRIGTLHVGEIPVIIAVSAAHRQAAFEACRHTIDTLKQKVPIWKKEIFEDGESWVAAHP